MPALIFAASTAMAWPATAPAASSAAAMSIRRSEYEERSRVALIWCPLRYWPDVGWVLTLRRRVSIHPHEHYRCARAACRSTRVSAKVMRDKKLGKAGTSRAAALTLSPGLMLGALLCALPVIALLPAYGVREPQGSATQTAYLSLRLEELSERIERAERLPQPPTEAAASAMERDIADLLTLADELAAQMPPSTRLILQRLTLEHQALRRSVQYSSGGNGSRINFEERRRESLLRLGAAREDLLARLERQSAWSASLRDISRNWMLYAALLAAAVLLLALHRYRRAPIAMATPAGRAEDVDHNLGDAEV